MPYSVKAHLKDGSTIVYPKGMSISGHVVHRAGVRHDLTLSQSTNVDNVPVESVVGMEGFRTEVKGPESLKAV